MNDECSGCSTENFCREHGFLDSRCPCCTCLVKPVCSSACDGYSGFTVEREHKIGREKIASRLEEIRK